MQVAVESADSRSFSSTKLTPVPDRAFVRASRQIDRDVQAVGELQRALLPLPKIPGLEIAASYQPRGYAGGDLYDIFPLDEASPGGRWWIFIGDASGHGLMAAVVILMLQSILRAHPPGIDSPAQLLAHCNRHLCLKQIRGFVTAFIGLYEPSTRRLAYARAGHPPPLMRDSVGGAVSRLDAAASYPLGIDALNPFVETTIRVPAGSTLLLYTDGITEARSPDNEMFSEEQLQLALAVCCERPAGLVGRLAKLIRMHRQGGAPTDDETLVAIAGI